MAKDVAGELVHIVEQLFFFFNDPAPTEIYTLPLHDALPISRYEYANLGFGLLGVALARRSGKSYEDRKSTRLNSSHSQISYAVFCLKKKKNVPLSMPKKTSCHLLPSYVN